MIMNISQTWLRGKGEYEDEDDERLHRKDRGKIPPAWLVKLPSLVSNWLVHISPLLSSHRMFLVHLKRYYSTEIINATLFPLF